MEFQNENELKKWLLKNQGTLVKQGYVTSTSGNVSSGDKFTGLYLDDLNEHVRRLKQLLEMEVETYYDTYFPNVYRRTYEFKNSVRVGKPVIESDGRVSVEIYFDPDRATHDSLLGGEQGFVPILLNEGWHWRGERGNTGPYRFARYHPEWHGRRFVENAIEKYISNVQPDKKTIEVLKAITFHGQTTWESMN